MTRLGSSPVPDPLGGSVHSSVAMGFRFAGPGDMCRVEMWRGGLGAAYPVPALSSVGASLASPCCRFHTPLIGAQLLSHPAFLQSHPSRPE
jgi:hypothetical protein